MIIFVLIGIAAGLLVTAQFTGTVQFTIVALAVSMISIVIVVARAWMDRRTRQRDTAAAQAIIDDDAGTVDAEAVNSEDETSDTERSHDEDVEEEDVDERATPTAVPDVAVAVVRVIPGRKRFHEPDCSSLSGRQSDELTREEAEEEGFTPCSRCNVSERAIRRVV